MWRVLSIAILLCVMGIAACSDPKTAIIPDDPSKWESDLKPVTERLSQDERDLLTGYFARMKIAQAFGGNGVPSGTSVGGAIDQQREWQKNLSAKEAESKALKEETERQRAAIQAQFDSVLTVALVSKTIQPADSQARRFSDQFQYIFSFYNKGAKDIAGFKGIARFRDIFGDEVASIRLSNDERIPAGQTYNWRGTTDYNQFSDKDRRLRNMEMDKIRFVFEIQAILFTDGSKLEIPEGATSTR